MCRNEDVYGQVARRWSYKLPPCETMEAAVFILNMTYTLGGGFTVIIPLHVFLQEICDRSIVVQPHHGSIRIATTCSLCIWSDNMSPVTDTGTCNDPRAEVVLARETSCSFYKLKEQL